jgi:REP element-mobilizing transposase RayT
MYLFITSTTYAQWLPGDKRGFVSRVGSEIHNKYGTPYDADVPWLKKCASDRLIGEPVFLNSEQAQVLFEQWQKTIAHRHWKLYGAAVMANHIHILLETNDDTQPENVARDLKSYGSRRLNQVFGTPASGTWWTQGSSIRRKTADSIPRVIRYIKDQPHSLLIWIAPEYDVE